MDAEIGENYSTKFDEESWVFCHEKRGEMSQVIRSWPGLRSGFFKGTKARRVL
jgi:hypothetical protein